MPSSQRLFLIGPMGAGKSTIGRRLAQRLGLRFVDSDQEIELCTGVDIPRIFDVEGESGFRRREEDMIDRLSEQDGVVLATGGGAILSAETRRRLAERGTVIYLRTSVDQQYLRTRRDRRRPLLQTENPQARLEALLAERGPLYEATADVTVDTDHGSIVSVVRQIIAQLNPQDPDA
ncbi:shikimate kinase [Natronocella acetinitrilica]|uniref:Shikimate kinase n=1 Tax=Natronocella acetinitrilica TaxID=414046 RepID=A0AAE3G6T1_9GAMM|nr:shikimate kinase AroK [Natronocella acetinitrilica]MCP1676876.1 shikimate kinase [Natronocella acetinitrilica]